LTTAYSWELFSLFAELFFFKRNSNYQSISEYDQIKLQKVRNALLKDLSRPKTIKELEVIGSMSATKLRSMFKEVYGLSIYQYFQRHRMEEAKRLLELRKMNVSDVAYTVGYNHLGYFTAAFKKQFGILPKSLIK
ncbi:MAG: helix-turn-helix domain-containing protein, partial [Muribaculaceae bacterium]